MKPSQRIMEISRNLNKDEPLQKGFIRSQAILDYLDEEYEDGQLCKCHKCPGKDYPK